MTADPMTTTQAPEGMALSRIAEIDAELEADQDRGPWGNDPCMSGHDARVLLLERAELKLSIAEAKIAAFHREAEAAVVGDLTPGQLLHELRRPFFNGGGWADFPEWADYDDAGHAKWEKLAAIIGADLKRAVGESLPPAINTTAGEAG